LSSTGGFLKKGNTTMLIGTDVEKEQSILDLIKKVCDENDIESDNESKANIFVMDLEDFKKF
ncbi:MAG: cyclic-di-AMP receptor, partial [Finegoldia magna]